MTGWPEGVARRLFEEIDSTNAEAQRLALGGETGPLWILAHRQTRGRGRRGRTWSGPTGNFYGSCLLTPGGDPANSALRSFTAALALREALIGATGRDALFSLKWPNDVLLSGRKLAGILLEMCSTGPGRPQALAVGIGVNLAHAPEPETLEPGALPPAGLAHSTGIVVAPEAFAELLATSFARWEVALQTSGFEPVRRAWLSAAARLGEEVIARLPGREVRGIFRAIDETGAILLDTSYGRVALPAAEIYFPAEDARASGGCHAAGH